MSRRLLYTLAIGIPAAIFIAILGYGVYFFFFLTCCSGL
jgi:hypothetical protein